MYLVVVLSAVVGAAIFFAGWYLRDRVERKKEPRVVRKKVRKPRPPKCYVVVPGEPDEEHTKKRKKRPVSRGAAIVPFDESKIKGRDILV